MSRSCTLTEVRCSPWQCVTQMADMRANRLYITEPSCEVRFARPDRAIPRTCNSTAGGAWCYLKISQGLMTFNAADALFCQVAVDCDGFSIKNLKERVL